jgi:hypothetical protein
LEPPSALPELSLNSSVLPSPELAKPSKQLSQAVPELQQPMVSIPTTTTPSVADETEDELQPCKCF